MVGWIYPQQLTSKLLQMMVCSVFTWDDECGAFEGKGFCFKQQITRVEGEIRGSWAPLKVDREHRDGTPRAG